MLSSKSRPRIALSMSLSEPRCRVELADRFRLHDRSLAQQAYRQIKLAKYRAFGDFDCHELVRNKSLMC